MAQIARPLERLLLHATHEAQLLAALTPVDAHKERARLIDAVRARRNAMPHWSYVPKVRDDLRRALYAAEHELARTAESPLHALALARIRELSVEAALCCAAGTADVARLAHERFPAPEPDVGREVAELCSQWLAEAPAAQEGEPIASDADDPRSLLSRMRAAVGQLRLPFSVVTRPTLAPLAATGEHVILVATGRPLREEDAVRTVLHEIEGHARPRARATGATVVLFRAGTARGVDDQEGRALLLEERAGLLGPARRHHLAARHWAVEAMLGGATFDDVARMLVDAHGLDAADAVVIAERAFRGGNGVYPGLGRERVYLESLVLVRRHLARCPEDEAVLQCGQVALEACSVLRPYAPPSP
jgi:hypothetical protein